MFSFEHCFVVHCLAIKTFCQIYILYFFTFFKNRVNFSRKRQGTIPDHRYLIEVDLSSGQSKFAKSKDKEYTINAQIFWTTSQKRKRLMHQVFNIFLQMVSCWFMLVMLYLPLLDICVPDSILVKIRIIIIFLTGAQNTINSFNLHLSFKLYQNVCTKFVYVIKLYFRIF